MLIQLLALALVFVAGVFWREIAIPYLLERGYRLLAIVSPTAGLLGLALLMR